MTGGFSLDKVASPGKGRAPPLPLQESNRPSKAPKVDDLVVVQEEDRAHHHLGVFRTQATS